MVINTFLFLFLFFRERERGCPLCFIGKGFMYFLVFSTIENASQYKMSPFSNKMTSTNYIKRANGSSYGTLSLFNFFFSSVTSQKGEFR